MADKSKHAKAVGPQDVCELIELAIDDVNLLSRAFDVIAAACASKGDERLADKEPKAPLVH